MGEGKATTRGRARSREESAESKGGAAAPYTLAAPTTREVRAQPEHLIGWEYGAAA